MTDDDLAARIDDVERRIKLNGERIKSLGERMDTNLAEAYAELEAAKERIRQIKEAPMLWDHVREFVSSYALFIVASVIACYFLWQI